MDYNQKYLKYKLKYHNLESKKGGRCQFLGNNQFDEPIYRLTVNFSTKDLGFYDLVNDNIKGLITDIRRYQFIKQNYYDDSKILLQTSPFNIGGLTHIDCTVKLFEDTVFRENYQKKLLTWKEIACDLYGLESQNQATYNVKANVCSVGNNERRIFYKIRGNFFHYLLHLNEESYPKNLYNHTFFIHTCKWLFNIDNQQLLVHSLFHFLLLQ